MGYRTARIAGIIIITGFAAVLLVSGITNPGDLGDTFVVDAIYYEEQDLVRISFEDSSALSTSVILEVLGMDETFQRHYAQISFTEEVYFEFRPKFGWKVHPVTFVVEHPELGTIGIKTEIRAPGDPEPDVIFSRL